MLNKQPSNSWVSDIQEADKKEEFLRRLLESKTLFLRMKNLVEIKVRDNNKARLSSKSYDKPAWSENQADKNGYERGLTEVLSLLQFT